MCKSILSESKTKCLKMRCKARFLFIAQFHTWMKFKENLKTKFSPARFQLCFRVDRWKWIRVQPFVFCSEKMFQNGQFSELGNCVLRHILAAGGCKHQEAQQRNLALSTLLKSNLQTLTCPPASQVNALSDEGTKQEATELQKNLHKCTRQSHKLALFICKYDTYENSFALILPQACWVLMHKLSADKKRGRYCMSRFFLRGYLRSGGSGSK